MAMLVQFGPVIVGSGTRQFRANTPCGFLKGGEPVFRRPLVHQRPIHTEHNDLSRRVGYRR
jgi:hypothetical protein